MRIDGLTRSVGFTGLDERDYIVNYYLTSRGKAFGIAAEKVAADAGAGLLFNEWEDTGGITYDKDEALRLLNRLADGIVTPTTLCEMVDELTAEV
ncbi:MAG: DUF6514 family protein [Clostridiales bacterium]|jgi:hypothetical protein|nr:DUF6514 family protein [Clostridiales bacterium]